MTKFLGIEFAPLSMPFERRLQTASVCLLLFHIIFSMMFSIPILIYLLFTWFFWFTCLYVAWWLYDRRAHITGGRRIRSARKFRIFNYLRDYFPAKLVKTADLDPTRNYIFTVHPHGPMALGTLINFATEATGFSQVFPGIRPSVLTLHNIFRIPIHREMALSLGACSASRESIDWLLTKEGTGNAVVLVPGGTLEQLYAVPGRMDFVLASRKGFIRMALKHGADLVPVISFGENDMFKQKYLSDDDPHRKFQLKAYKKTALALTSFRGRGIFQYTFGILPHRRPITSVVGVPIKVDKVPEPSVEQVDALHQKYCQTLLEFYDQEKAKYCYEGVPLIFK